MAPRPAVIAALSVLLLAAAPAAGAASAVVEFADLTPETFDVVVGDPGRSVLVLWRTAWCGACSAFAPAWEQLGRELAAGDAGGGTIGPLTLATADVDLNRGAAKAHRVGSFPTLMLFAAGGDRVGVRTAARDAAGLKAFLNGRV